MFFKKKKSRRYSFVSQTNLFFFFFYLGLFRIPISLNHFLTLANLHWILRILISKWEDSFLILSQEIFQSALFWLHALLKGSMHVACAHCFDIWFQCISDATRMTQRENFCLQPNFGTGPNGNYPNTKLLLGPIFCLRFTCYFNLIILAKWKAKNCGGRVRKITGVFTNISNIISHNVPLLTLKVLFPRW